VGSWFFGEAKKVHMRTSARFWRLEYRRTPDENKYKTTITYDTSGNAISIAYLPCPGPINLCRRGRVEGYEGPKARASRSSRPPQALGLQDPALHALPDDPGRG
jgi:hypothetical protein